MVKMVDISSKVVTEREAEAEGVILLQASTVAKIQNREIEKGDVQSVAELMGIQGIKLTPQLMPLCHPLSFEDAHISFKVLPEGVKVIARVKAQAKTGVEMEALSAVITALLNVWDMVKKYEKDIDGQYPSTQITDIRVTYKHK